MTPSTAPLTYLGSKRRQAEEIAALIGLEQERQANVADLFSGTGSVSREIVNRGSACTAVDVQEYARVLSCAMTASAQDAARIDVSATTQSIKAAHEESAKGYQSLIAYELEAIADAVGGSHDSLCLITEVGQIHQAYSHLTRPKQFKKLLCDARSVSAGNHMILHYYGGTYFSYDQALELDAICEIANRSTGVRRDLMLAASLIAASRICPSVGAQFAQPPKARDSHGRPKSNAVLKIAHARTRSIIQEFESILQSLVADALGRDKSGIALKATAEDFLRSCNDYDAIYADPPYSRYHYSRYYHVYESICLYDWPDITANPATKLPSRGIYRANRYQSNYSTRTRAAGEFGTLLDLVQKKTDFFVLSYSPFPNAKAATPRMVTVDWLAAEAAKRFKHVEVASTRCDVVHSRLNTKNRELPVADHAEVYLICKN